MTRQSDWLFRFVVIVVVLFGVGMIASAYSISTFSDLKAAFQEPTGAAR